MNLMKICYTTGDGNTHQIMTRKSARRWRKKTERCEGGAWRPEWSVTCKNNSGLFYESPKLRYQFIQEHPEHPITKCTRILRIG